MMFKKSSSPRPQIDSPMLSSANFIVFPFLCSSHFQPIFLYGDRWGCCFILHYTLSHSWPCHLLNNLFFFLKLLFIYYYYFFWLCWVFVSVWGLPLVAASGGHSSSQCTGLSLSWPLLSRSTGSRRAGSVVMAHGPSCSVACGIFPDQGSNPCPLHWQADSQPLRHQGSPNNLFFFYWFVVPNFSYVKFP